ncbi:putative N-acetylated-alpha-linked acidic dipeptidase isoform X2 [Dendronephthya gigantea]|uniref:putative N-acetylated-alpha-linked acidic dipeptidase isoform X2 n=1 Tax=Dendronephthya gigantea TaxID=151771 RepID=UPI00106C1089|nr:putative N-acetylated-alpha-linked acidic dipeptidase isoform X2 [Dendronephthya gigantea]
MAVFAMEKPKKTYKLGFVLILLIVTIVISFSIGLVAGYFATKKEDKSEHDEPRRHNVEDLLEILSAKQMKNTTRYFSLEPHMAGSNRSKRLADEISRRWKNYGFHVDTIEYDVLLPQVDDDSPDYIEIKDRNGSVIMKHTFAAVGKSDPSSNKTWTIPRFFFYSPSGTAEGGLLYLNDAKERDFEDLKKLNVSSCNGSVVLIQQDFQRMIEQIQNAYKCNASGVLFFDKKEKMDQTTGNMPVYPNGIRLPEEQPMAFGLLENWEIGDPLTPYLPSSDGVYRLTDYDWPAKLPVQRVEYDIALKLLKQLGGHPIPEKWKIHLNSKENYRTGPTLINNSKLQLTVNSKAKTTKIYDVIGTVYGSEEPDSWVLVGNHRDAITFGAIDAVSGTSGMMELSRAIGELLKTGWKPKRTIKLCSWAAEEMGIIGSTEYVQDNKKILQERAVAYINIDMMVHGNGSLRATGNPLTRDLVYTQSQKVLDPHGPKETIYSIWKKGRPDKGNDRPQYNTVSLGSDYIPFYEMAGVPSIDLQYGSVPFKLPRAYHTVYDTYHLISMFDPQFKFHLAQTKLTARIVYELSNSPIIPFNINSFTSSLHAIANRTKDHYEKQLKQHNITLSKLFEEVKALQRAGKKFEQMKNDSKSNSERVRQINRRMIAFNKIFISPKKIPSRPSEMRNLVLGISQNWIYPKITLTGISDAVIAARTSGRWEIVKEQISLTEHAIIQARRSLEMPQDNVKL